MTGSAMPAAADAVDALRWQAASCADGGSPLYAALLASLADDAQAGGPTAAVLAGHDADPAGSALGLRLMAAVHRAVLERRAPALALFYPSVGGTGDPRRAWPALRDLLATRREEIRRDLDRPCQTNEPGRAAGLLVGLLHAVRGSGEDRVRLLELGASGGLNLRVDAYRIGVVGPADSPVRIPAPDLPAAPYAVTDRAGCDPAPVDVTTAEGRTALTASVWADQGERLERLRGALAVAQRLPAPLVRAGAAAFLTERLGAPYDGLTVVWHSVVRQYVDPAEWAEVERLLAAAGEKVAHVSMEPEQGVGFPIEVTLRGSTRRVAVAGPHGPPLRLVEGAA